MSRSLRDALVAGSAAAVVSGSPSTLHALVTGRDPLESSLAAGSMLLPAESDTTRLLVAATVAHTALSLGWALILARLLPRRAIVLSGVLAGAGIAWLDLKIIGSRFPRIAALQFGPQLADHIAYAVTVAAVLKKRGER